MDRYGILAYELNATDTAINVNRKCCMLTYELKSLDSLNVAAAQS